MTHRYTLLVGGIVLAGPREPEASAIAWAAGTILAVGSDEDILAISRGDSHVIDLGGATVVPLGGGPHISWPTDATLVIGARADLAIVAVDPRGLDPAARRDLAPIALIRGGRVVAGGLPGDGGHDHGPPTSDSGPLRS